MSKKTEVTVKSNGLRNELKEIRKSIDKLTEVILLQQTNEQNEKIKRTLSLSIGGILLMGCTSQLQVLKERQALRTKTYQKIIDSISIDSPEQIKLAQILWNKTIRDGNKK